MTPPGPTFAGGVHRQARVAEVLAERREVDAAAHGLAPAPAPCSHRLDDLGLGLEHLVARAGPRAARARTRSARAGRGCSGRRGRGRRGGSPPRRRSCSARARRARSRCRAAPPLRTSTAGCGPSMHEQAQDARLVGRQLVEDAHVGRVACPRRRVDVGRAAQQLGAAVAQGSRAVRPTRRLAASRSGVGSRRRRPRRRRCRSSVAQRQSRSSSPCRWSSSAGGSPDAADRARARAASSVERRPHVQCRAAQPGGSRAIRARPRAEARRTSLSLDRRASLTSEDRQVDQAGAEAEHRAVEIEQPLVLAHRRAQHLREVAGRTSRACARRSACACAALWRRLNSGSASGVIV